MDKFFSKPFFEQWLKKAGSKTKDWFNKEIGYLKENIKPKSKILDVGCGFGRHMEILAPLSQEVVGIDSEESMVNKTKQRLADFNNAKVFTGVADNLSFDDNQFDYVICMTNTFGNLLDKKEQALKEMKRVCKRGGKIIISVYSEKSLDVRKKDYEKVGLHITKIRNNTLYTKEGLISELFNKSQLKALFDEIGLKSKIIELNPISYLCELSKI